MQILNDKKSIIRWTIGNTSKSGLECLKFSIKKFIYFYKENFDYYVCYNNINFKEISDLSHLDVKFIDQKNFIKEINIPPKDNPCWKLYPPRIDINSYEIFVDNDLVLHKKIDLENYISNKKFFITEAIKKSYGSFNDLINEKFNFNTGFFGIPPFFDFKKEINNVVEKFNVNWENSRYEEQGLVSYIFKNLNYEIIDLNKIYVCYKNYKKGIYGMHFVGLNKNFTKYWDFYKIGLI